MNQEKGEEKRKPGFSRPFSLLQIYQLRKAIFWSDEWGAPHLKMTALAGPGVMHVANPDNVIRLEQSQKQSPIVGWVAFQPDRR